MRRALLAVIALLLVVAAGVWLRLGRREAPELPGALRELAVPPAPVLSPEQALASFRVAPGFRVELVASEPLVEDPVALAWDGRGRLFVVEMRGFMPDVEGHGEEQPVGRVVVLEDHDGDGRMDESHVFLDGLVLPRAVAVLPEGVLIGEPPHLWLCHDADDDRRCDEPMQVGEYGVGAENVEHSENGLLPGLDGWLYNAKSARRLRLKGAGLEEGRTLFRGQWGIAQDDEGRLYTNNNSNFAYVDPWPAEGLLRHPGMRPETGGVPGVAVDLAPGAEVFGVRPALGANRAYVEGTLRADGRLLHPTGVSGIAVQRSPALGEEGIGDLFVPEVVGNVVARFRPDPGVWRAEHLLEPDPDFGQREFLASTDERFRPVNVSFGPHGGLLVVDMYRGIIQHRTYVSDYLRAYIERQGMDRPLGLGRIWRVVREGRPLRRLPADPGRSSLGERIALLDDPDGCWRDLAARWLVRAGAPAAQALQRGWAQLSARARVHALWVLAQQDALGGELLGRAVADPEEAVRRAAWRAAASAWSESPRGRSGLEERAEKVRVAQLAARVLAGEVAKSRGEAVLAALALGEHAALPRVQTALAQLLGRAEDDEVLRAAVLSGLAGRELRFATKLLAGRPWRIPVEPRDRALSDLARLVFLRLGAAGDDDAARRERDDFVAWLGRLPAGSARTALLDGLGRAARVPGQRPMVLSGPPPLFSAEPDESEADPDFLAAWRRARKGITWIGDENVPGAVPLTEDDKKRLARGRSLYAQTCAACHQPHGHGQAGLAPPLAGSPWVLESDGWLVRIVLEGLTGPVEVAGETWDAAMPGHGADPRFDDEAAAGLFTFLRRSWGHTGAPLAPATVAAIRAASADRQTPWTVEELLALDVDHVLDRYVGRYALERFPMTLTVSRQGRQLRLAAPLRGESLLAEDGNGGFRIERGGEGASEPAEVVFVESADGSVTGLRLDYGGQKVSFQRVP